jgi:hypothetical protein
MEMVDPRNLPFDPEMPEDHPHRGALDEPVDDRRGRWDTHVPSLTAFVQRLRSKLSLRSGDHLPSRTART